MDELLQAFDQEWKTGDRAKAKEMAKAFIAENREPVVAQLKVAVRALREAHLDDEPTIPEIVQLIDGYRAAGLEGDRILADMLLLAEYQPQHITGVLVKRLSPRDFIPQLQGAVSGG